MSTGAIVAIIVVPIVLLILLVFGFAAVGVLMARSAAKSAAAPYAATAAPAALTETYPTKNGLLVAHYPSDYAAKSLDEATLVVSRNNLDGTDELVQLAAVDDPISDDVNEFGRILLNGLIKNIEKSGDHWTETSRTHTACFKSYPGLLVEGTFTAKGITKEKMRLCFFMNANHAYEIETMVPATREATDYPTLQAIIEATDLK